jgi:hypothetical protein
MQMKKVLYGSTALATAALVAAGAGEAAAAERIQLQISGYMQQWLVGVDQSFNDAGGQIEPGGFQRFPTTSGFRVPQSHSVYNVDQKTNAEICFVGQTTLDNGITFGVNVQLEAYAAGNHIDETYLFLSSDRFGRLILGSEDAASSLLHVAPPNGGISVDDGDVPTMVMFKPVSGVIDGTALTTDLDFRGDSNKFTYITPRFYGFQAGASYTPLGNDVSSNPQSGEAYNSGWAAGLNYSNVFSNGFGVQASAGLQGFNQTCGTRGVGTNPFDAANDTDGSCNQMLEWSANLNGSYAGFTIGGGYKQSYGNTGASVATFEATGGTHSQLLNGRAWSVGGAYETGPYTVGITYTQGSGTGWNIPGSGDYQSRIGAVSGTYVLGPGIRLVGGFFLFEQKAEMVPGVRGNAGSPNNVRTTAANSAARAAGIQNTSTSMGWGGAMAVTASF